MSRICNDEYSRIYEKYLKEVCDDYYKIKHLDTLIFRNEVIGILMFIYGTILTVSNIFWPIRMAAFFIGGWHIGSAISHSIAIRRLRKR